MLNILLVSIRRGSISELAKGLSSDPEVCVDQVTSGAEALNTLGTKCPHLIIIDSGLPDTEPLNLVRKIINANAMVNTAVVSPLSDEDFHVKSEGLGVLCRLPPDPGSNDSRLLLRKLRRALGLVDQSSNEEIVKGNRKPFLEVEL
ncbi:MAG: response regulator [Syntrophobacteraceae bacterium]